MENGFIPRNPFEQRLRSVPDSECRYAHARSGGAGGQKVNKTSSKVLLRWDVGASRSFSEEEKQKIRDVIGVNVYDEVYLECDEERSQHQNKRIVKERLDALVTEALKPVIERKPTKLKYGIKQKRLDEKSRHGEMKRGRRLGGED